MDEYPEELQTPPVTLISLIGCPDLHQTISTHLHSEQPPINTLAFPDFSKISSLWSKSSSSSNDDLNPGNGGGSGILKRDWLRKHRTRKPAVISALFDFDFVSGDPAQWLQFCTDLDNLKTVIRGINIKLVLIVVQTTSKYEISEDRMVALRKRAEVDSKHLIMLSPNDPSELKQSLDRLARTFAELANTYYRDEGRKIKTRIEKKNFNSIEMNIRYCFKVAVYAEFRRDWAEALRFYEDAYHLLREMIGATIKLPTVQRLIEIKGVAEQIHFKISTLLLHRGKVVEAVAWFRQHNASYRKLTGSSEVLFLHWEWLSRQFLVFAELLESSSAIIQSFSSPASGAVERPLTEWEILPAYYYQLATQHLKEKKSCLELSLSMSETSVEIDSNAESVIPSVYVGQFVRLLEQGDGFATQLLTDEDYTRYALSEGKRFQDSIEIIALLNKSYESFTTIKNQRMASFCGSEMASEYYFMDDFKNAKKLFEQVASLYRQEGWVTLLWEVLGYLRECSKKIGLVKEFIEYSLEMAVLPVTNSTSESSRFKECGPAGPASLTQRQIIHKEVVDFVKRELTEGQPVHLEIDPVSPLRVVLLSSVAFHEQIVKPGALTSIMLSLLSELPHTIELDELEVQFNQPECNFFIVNEQRGSSGAASSDHAGKRRETAPVLALVTNKWLRLTYDIKSEQSGKLECISVIARMGPHFTICCRAESPASMDDLPLWKFEDCMDSFPTKDHTLAFSGQKAIQVEEPEPQVDLNLGNPGPALVGESFMVPVSVTSKGHTLYSGELKINLVGVRGGGMVSPRELEPSSIDTHHVEFLGIAGPEGEDEPKTGSDSIKKIQQSFGLVSIPQLNNGESWSCILEIKWHRPKQVMLYVSLGYSPQGDEANAQKVHVHRSLQIEGKPPIIINHRFMLPFRRDPLLLSKIKPSSNSDELASLPSNETSILVVSAKNSTEVPLQFLSISIEAEDDDDLGKSCSVEDEGEELVDPTLVVPDKEFKKVFSIIPTINFTKIKTGVLCLKWRRASNSDTSAASWVTTKHRLPDANVELPPIVATLECPPNAILGNPFTYFVIIKNQTHLLQEINFSLADSQSFLLSGSHNDTVIVLPKSEHILSCKLVPLASSLHQMPKITVTATRYSAGFQPSVSASTVFVFPSKPSFLMTGERSREQISAK